MNRIDKRVLRKKSTVIRAKRDNVAFSLSRVRFATPLRNVFIRLSIVPSPSLIATVASIPIKAMANKSRNPNKVLRRVIDIILPLPNIEKAFKDLQTTCWLTVEFVRLTNYPISF